MKPAPKIRPPGFSPPRVRSFIQKMRPTAVMKAQSEPRIGQGLGSHQMVIVIRLGVTVGHFHSPPAPRLWVFLVLSSSALAPWGRKNSAAPDFTLGEAKKV